MIKVMMFIMGLLSLCFAQGKPLLVEKVDHESLDNGVRLKIVTNSPARIITYEVADRKQMVIDVIGDAFSNLPAVIDINNQWVGRIKAVRGSPKTIEGLDSSYYVVDFFIVDLKKPLVSQISKKDSSTIVDITMPREKAVPGAAARPETPGGVTAVVPPEAEVPGVKILPEKDWPQPTPAPQPQVQKPSPKQEEIAQKERKRKEEALQKEELKREQMARKKALKEEKKTRQAQPPVQVESKGDLESVEGLRVVGGKRVGVTEEKVETQSEKKENPLPQSESGDENERIESESKSDGKGEQKQVQQAKPKEDLGPVSVNDLRVVGGKRVEEGEEVKTMPEEIKKSPSQVKSEKKAEKKTVERERKAKKEKEEKEKLTAGMKSPEKPKTESVSKAQRLREIGLKYQKNGKLDDAIKYYKKAIEADKKYAVVYNDLGVAYMKKRLLDKAIIEFEKALEIAPGLAKAHSNLAVAYEALGEWDKAEYHWEMRAKTGEPNDPWTLKAKEKLKEYEAATQLQIVEQPKETVAPVLEGKKPEAQVQQQARTEAVAAVPPAPVEQPKAPAKTEDLAAQKRISGELKKQQLLLEREAIKEKKRLAEEEARKKELAKKEELERKHKEKQEAMNQERARKEMARQLEAEEARLKKAQVGMAKAEPKMVGGKNLRPAPVSLQYRERAIVLRDKGYRCQKEGKINTAIRYYQMAIEEDKNYPTAHNDLGVIYMTKGWTEKAISEFEKALGLDNSYAKAHSNLALAYEALGDIEKAQFHWQQRVVLGDPDDPGTKKAEAILEEYEASAVVPVVTTPVPAETPQVVP
jgi:tetratricopeptide (TPR) repeat protein